MGGFCLLVELHREGSSINGVTPSSLAPSLPLVLFNRTGVAGRGRSDSCFCMLAEEIVFVFLYLPCILCKLKES